MVKGFLFNFRFLVSYLKPVIWLILLVIALNPQTFANEPLVKYKMMHRTDANGNRILESDPRSYEDIRDFPNSTFGDLNFTVPRFGPKGTTIDPNNPEDNFPDDCYPDSNSLSGNIEFTGRVISNISNNPISGAVVAVYMGAENTYNLPDVDHLKDGNEDSSTRRFVVGGKDRYGRLTNLYYYDITKEGKFRVFACNDYKKLSANRLRTLAQVNPDQFGANATKPLPEGYTRAGDNSIYYDYSIAYPKFSIAVICGLAVTPDKKNMAPIIGEIYSIVTYNDEYKQPNRPNYMRKAGFDIRVNCPDDVPPFTVPMNLDYSSPSNIASCRMDDISPNLLTYMNTVKAPLRNRAFDTSPASLTVPNSTVTPNLSALPECTPGDLFCLKNFLTLAIPKPDNATNIFNYGDKTYLDPESVSDKIKEQRFAYTYSIIDRKVDLDDTNNTSQDFIPKSRNSTEGQLDAKVDLSSAIDDYKFDLGTLRQLYGCFTNLNAPETSTSAYIDDLKFNDLVVARQQGTPQQVEVKRAAYTNNIRIPSCRELFCASQINPDSKLCRFPKSELLENNYLFLDSVIRNPDHPSLYYIINATSAYGPAVTLSTLTHEEITKNFMVLAKQLINSDFNPKATHPDPAINASLNYKPVTNIGEVPGCFNDQGNLVYLNGPNTVNEGSITYTFEGNTTTFYSPIPLLSFISIPYSMELFHANTGDNYRNMNTNDPTPFFPEECDITSPANPKQFTNQKFANCRKAVLPGGVYSISALTIISKMCSDAVRVPIANFGTFQQKAERGLAYNNANETLYKGYIDIEPSVTKIGSVQSLCLCEPGDTNCNLKSHLNNAYDETPANRRYEGMSSTERLKVISNFAVSSLVGPGDQSDTKNFIGVLCKNKFTDNSRQSPVPAVPCEIGNLSNYDGDANGYTVNIKDPIKFVQNSNIRVTWPFSEEQLNLTPDKYEYLIYQWENVDRAKSNDPLVNERISAYKKEGGTVNLIEYVKKPEDEDLERLVLKWGQCNLIEDVYLYDGSAGNRGGISPRDINRECRSGSLDVSLPDSSGISVPFECRKSSVEKRCTENKSLNVKPDPRYVSDITVTDKAFDDKTRIKSEPYIEGERLIPGMKVVQETSDGTTGSLKAKYSFQNAKYDPIPQVLNGFRDFATYAVVPSINSICRAPKLGAVVDIRVRELDYSGRNFLSTKPSSAIENYTAGLHCNSYIPEELDRCNVPNFETNMDPAWVRAMNASGLVGEQRREYCKAIRCKILCQHMYTQGNYYFYGEMQENLDTPQYYCRNLNPTRGVEMQVNKGDEGCVLDYVDAMRQVYALPFSLDDRFETSVMEEKLNKSLYPVFNNNLCLYPNVNKVDPDAGFDRGNCVPFMKTLDDNFQNQINNTFQITIGGNN